MAKDERIVARVIIQMLGAPKEHIEKTLKEYIDKIKDEHKDIKILNKYQSKAKKEKNDKLFKVFSELEIEVKGVDSLVWFCFDYMPASVEIVEPDKLVYDSHEFTNFLNDLQAKLHKLDMLLKHFSAENIVVKKNGMALMKNIIILQLRTGPKGIKTLAANAGVPQDHIERFLNSMIKEGKIKKDKNLYKLI